MKKALSTIWARLREPSTLAGIGVLATLAGVPPGTIDAAAQVVAGAASLAAIVKADKPAADAKPEGK